MARCLVVINQTLGGKQLTSVIQDRVDAGIYDFVVIAPLTPPENYAPNWVVPVDPGLDGLLPEAGSADALLAADRAHEETERRLGLVLDRVRAVGARAEGLVGDPDPETATQEALEDFEITEIILCTLPASISQWLGMDLPSQLRRHTRLPVTTVESSEGYPLTATEPGDETAASVLDTSDHGPDDAAADPADDLQPARPGEKGVPETQPEAMQIEGARLLANKARAQLHSRGFDDEQIRRWAEAFIDGEGSGSVDEFIAWIGARETEHARRRRP